MNKNTSPGGSGTGRIRCAVYARYSCDNSRPTSIEDQIRNCKDEAEVNNWVILPEFIRSDKAVSGETLFARAELLALLEAAKQIPRPFDCLLIDDTSRLGRNLPDVLRLSDIFMYHGVFLYFVSQRLDSRDPNSRVPLTINGLQDENYLAGLRAKTRRGLKGRVLAGYNAGAKTYGYRSVPIYSSTRKDAAGRPEVEATVREIAPEQAEIVLRIFGMRAAGATYKQIARCLNNDQIKSLHGGQWSYSTVRCITANELYRGIVKWGTSYRVTNPDTGKKRSRQRPKAEWVVKEHPELRIISEELWERVRIALSITASP